MDNSAMHKALIAVQKRVLKATKDGTNTFFNGSKYATLDSILEAVRGPLTENGFALVQDATTGEASVSVVTKLLHESGAELVSQPLSAPLKKEFTKTGVELPPSVQQIGSLVTYLRRYSLCPFLGVALDDDDDGNMASQVGQNAPGRGPSCMEGKEKAPAVPQQAGAGNRKSVYTGEALDTPEAVERHQAAAHREGGVRREELGVGGTLNVQRPTLNAEGGVRDQEGGRQRSEGETPHGAATNGDGGKAGKPLAVPPPDIMAFNTRLYDAMERDKISEEEITGYLNGTFGKPRISRPVLAGNMSIHNLGERIADALVSGTDKDGRRNWDTVVGRIRADRG